MQIRLCCCLKNIVKPLPICGKPSYRHQNHLCGWLAGKVRAFLRLMALNMLIYVNLCKFMQIRWVCGILQSPMTKSTGYQPGWIHKITLSESVSKRLNLYRNNAYIFGQKHVFVSKLHCVEIACVGVTDTLDT